jgi:hypothetical protein
MDYCSEVFGNRRIADFFNQDFDGKHVKTRLEAYNKQVERDKDRVRLHGQCESSLFCHSVEPPQLHIRHRTA